MALLDLSWQAQRQLDNITLCVLFFVIGRVHMIMRRSHDQCS